MQTLYLLCGVSGSGKSTYASKLADSTGAVIICPDSIRHELCRDAKDQSKNGLIFNVIVPKRIRDALRAGPSVIFDATSPDKRSRRQIMELAGKVRKECHFFEPNITLAKKQNKLRERQVPDSVIEKQAAKFVWPNYAEGFDMIYNISKKKRMDLPPISKRESESDGYSFHWSITGALL